MKHFTPTLPTRSVTRVPYPNGDVDVSVEVYTDDGANFDEIFRSGLEAAGFCGLGHNLAFRCNPVVVRPMPPSRFIIGAWSEGHPREAYYYETLGAHAPLAGVAGKQWVILDFIAPRPE